MSLQLFSLFYKEPKKKRIIKKDKKQKWWLYIYVKSHFKRWTYWTRVALWPHSSSLKKKTLLFVWFSAVLSLFLSPRCWRHLEVQGLTGLGSRTGYELPTLPSGHPPWTCLFFRSYKRISRGFCLRPWFSPRENTSGDVFAERAPWRKCKIQVLRTEYRWVHVMSKDSSLPFVKHFWKFYLRSDQNKARLWRHLRMSRIVTVSTLSRLRGLAELL